MKPRFALAAGIAAAFLVAACGSSASSPYAAAPSPSPAPSSSPYPTGNPVVSPTAVAGATVTTASTRLGRVLVDSRGRTLYLFLADKGTRSVCNSAECVRDWPPLLTKGAPIAGAGINAMLLGTTTRADGTREVTYAGHPLYYFVADRNAGDVTGQGVNSYGGLWYVVSPSGALVR
jgi:predicted lipoprotein with Yx(FWY)xxD motif